jgi:hypothetical protein
MQGMFSLFQIMRSHNRSNDGVGDPLEEAQTALFAAAKHFEGGETELVMLKDYNDQAGILLELRSIFVLPNGWPMIVVYWGWNTRETINEASTTIRLLQSMKQSSTAEVTCSAAGIEFVKWELHTRANQLDPMWRQQQDKYAGEGHACSFFTLLMPGEVPQGAGAAKANGAVPGAEKSMSVKELRRKIAEAGLSCGDCVEKCELQERCRNALVLLKKLGGAKLVDSADRFVDVLVQDSKAMPKIVYDEGDCSICLEELTKPADDEEIHGHEKKTLSCGHTFHEYCFDKWLDTKHRHCPNCNLGHVRDKEGGVFREC